MKKGFSKKLISIILIVFAACTLINAQGAGSWKFIVFGDTRSNHNIHREVLQSMKTNTPDYRFIINVGDLINTGYSSSDWNNWKSAMTDVFGSTLQDGTPPKYMGVPGNHEYLSNSTALNYWRNNVSGQVTQFGNDGRFFYFDYEDARFILLDSTMSLTGAQKTMLLDAIENNPKKWLFTIWHHPIFDFGPKSYQSSIHQNWGVPLYQNGCDIMFMGHAHYYVRSEKLQLNGQKNPPLDLNTGTSQIVVGNGAASMYSIDPNKDGNGYMVASTFEDYGYSEITIDGNTAYYRHIDRYGMIIDQEVYYANPKPSVTTPTPLPTVIVTPIPTATPTATPEPTPQFINIAPGKAVFASGEYSAQFPKVALNDGNDGTIWGSLYNKGNQWFFIDLGVPYQVEHVTLKFFDQYYSPYYHIGVSNDAKTWTFAHTITNGTGGTNTITLQNISARYVGVLLTNGAQKVYGVSEFEIYTKK